MVDVNQPQVPVVITDGTSTVTISGGALNVCGQGVFTVSGQSEGPAAPGVPASKSMLLGGVYNSQLPTPVTGQQLAIQLSGAGRVLVDPSGVITPVSGTVTANPGAGIFQVAQSEQTTGIVHHYQSFTLPTGQTGTLTYTVSPGKHLYVKGVQASSSVGPCKITFQNHRGPVVLATAFYSAIVPNVEVVFQQPLAFSPGTVVALCIQNNSGATQDVYGFLNGHEITA